MNNMTEKEKLDKKEQKAKEKEARIIAAENKRLIDSALRSADGYYVIEQEVVKVKTMKEFDGQLCQVEEIKVVPLKKYIEPDSKDRTFLIQSRMPQYNEKAKEKDNVLEVIFAGEALEDHCIEGYY